MRGKRFRNYPWAGCTSHLLSQRKIEKESDFSHSTVPAIGPQCHEVFNKCQIEINFKWKLKQWDFYKVKPVLRHQSLRRKEYETHEGDKHFSKTVTQATIEVSQSSVWNQVNLSRSSLRVKWDKRRREREREKGASFKNASCWHNPSGVLLKGL